MAYTGSKAQAGRGSTLSIGPSTISITGSMTTSSASVTDVSSTEGLAVGMPISGAGIPPDTTIAAIGSGTLTLSAEATATATGVALTVTATVEVGEVKSVPMKSGKWETADVTNFESGDDREFISTIRDNGTVDLAGNRVSGDTGQLLVEAAYQSGDISPFTLTLPLTASQETTGDTYTFKALVLSRDFTVDVTKEIDWQVSLKISGAVTFTAGS